MDVLPIKPFRTFEEQADMQLARNLIADKDELIKRLESTNYYRLAGYLYPFRQTGRNEDGSYTKLNTYRKGTTLNLVWKYYLFDRRLRFTLMDAIERIEIALRTRLAYHWAESTGRSNPQAFRSCYNPAFTKKNTHEDLLKKIQASYNRSLLDCVLHHKNQGLARVEQLPIWVMVELTTIGELVWIYKGLKENLRSRIASIYGFDDTRFFHSLLDLIHHARNACAHHARVWNVSWLQLPSNNTSPSKRNLLPIVRNQPENWNFKWDKHQECWAPGADESALSKTSTAFLLTACSYFLKRVAHTSSWQARFKELIHRPDTPGFAAREMGFPDHWEKHPFWN